ncbi:MAG TPA: polyribonucleotide nucleotidyltransferase, partial [Allosphingosinicella sp.]|nr:polyribonucleotide nucleotidyltransferase [Allosphingosinicella sp.]
EYILNPTQDQIRDGELDLVVAGTHNAVMMVESEAKELSEDVMLGGVMFAHRSIQPVIQGIISLAEKAAKDPWELDEPADNKAVKEKLRGLIGADIAAAYKLTDKQQRQTAINEARAKAREGLADMEASDPAGYLGALKLVKKLEAEIVRGAILKEGVRIDGRDTRTVRPIEAMVGFLPRTHGSALFTRGETQAIVTTTLGTKEAEQMIDGLEGLSYSRFMLHYNFPPYSVGEVGRFGAPSRRETGHGKLAWRALHPVLPSHEEFPYTIRILSDITESNGSSSMATVCGGCLALMDAGVPIKRPVSGIAMGLILEGKDFAVISDILGDEDHLGDMDFKVAGTEAGITSLQMDIKIAGITEEIMRIALDQANEGRAHILREMAKAIGDVRGELSAHAPRIETMQIDKAKIRDVIGTGGKIIREIVASTGAKVDIDDEGIIKISSSDVSQIEAARRWIQGIVEEPEVGKVYTGKVVNLVDFGAFVNFMGGKDGLVHVSEIRNERVERVADALSEGQEVKVKVLEIDPRGKVRLSMRVVDQETGAELEDTRPPREERPRGERSDRGPRRDGEGRGDRGGRDRGPRRDGGGGGGRDRDRGPRGEGGGDRGQAGDQDGEPDGAHQAQPVRHQAPDRLAQPVGEEVGAGRLHDRREGDVEVGGDGDEHRRHREPVDGADERVDLQQSDGGRPAGGGPRHPGTVAGPPGGAAHGRPGRARVT